MNIDQKRKIMKKIVKLTEDIEKLESIRLSLISNEFQSATISINGGSKSYTRQDVAKITQTISDLKQELKNSRRLIRGEKQNQPSSIYTVYSY